jgi:hypothetical protein
MANVLPTGLAIYLAIPCRILPALFFLYMYHTRDTQHLAFGIIKPLPPFALLVCVCASALAAHIAPTPFRCSHALDGEFSSLGTA